MYTDAIVSVDVNDADDQNPLFGQSRYWAHLPEPAKEVKDTVSIDSPICCLTRLVPPPPYRERVWKSDRNRCEPLTKTPESMPPFVMRGMQVHMFHLNIKKTTNKSEI